MASLLILLSIPIDLHLFFFILYKRTNLKIQSTIYALITFVLLTIYWYIMWENAGSGFLSGILECISTINNFLSAIIWFIALRKTTKNDYYLKTIDTVDKKNKVLLYSFIVNVFIVSLLASGLSRGERLVALSPFGMLLFINSSMTNYYKILAYLRIVLLTGQFIFFVILDNKDLQNKKIEKEEEHRND